MSEVTTTVNTDAQQTNVYNTAKIFLGQNSYETGFHNNGNYNDVTIEAGTLMGRVALTGELIPLFSDAVDGSQFPVGIMAEEIIFDAGETKTITICTAGFVDEDLVVLDPGDTMEAVISSRRLRDRIAADTVGIILRSSTEMTVADN